MLDAITTMLEHIASTISEIGYRLSLNGYEVSQNALLSGINYDTLETGGLDSLTTFFNLSTAPIIAQVGNLVADIGNILQALVDVL